MTADETMISLLYKAIAESITDGHSPSVRELAISAGIKSTSTVHKYLTTLENRGLIVRNVGVKRNISLPGATTKMVPIIGSAAAGAPILAQQEYLGFVPYGGNEHGDLFAIKVRGESMIKAGIMNGDTVIVKQTAFAQNGQIVLALIEEEATIKRFFKENGHFRLQPENDAMEPIVTEELVILGRIVACVRQYEEV